MSRFTFRSLPAFCAGVIALALAGCATPHQTSAEDPAATPEGGAPKTGDAEAKPDNANETKPDAAATAATGTAAEIATPTTAAPAPAVAEMPATSPAARAGVESSPALAVTAEPPANPETAKLIAQLNDASRELAILRATNARLSAERERDRDRERSLPRASEPVVRADPADEKLGASLKSFAALKQELSAFVTEMEQLRSENATFTSRLKEAQARADDAQSSLARLERELRAEKRSRQEAEQAAASLQEQLRAVARAVSSAGLNLDKATGEPSSTARLETNTSRPIKYKVKRGDTLESIAELYYGDASRWRVILDANRARLPLDGSLEVGAEIEIPRGR